MIFKHPFNFHTITNVLKNLENFKVVYGILNNNEYQVIFSEDIVIFAMSQHHCLNRWLGLEIGSLIPRIVRRPIFSVNIVDIISLIFI